MSQRQVSPFRRSPVRTPPDGTPRMAVPRAWAAVLALSLAAAWPLGPAAAAPASGGAMPSAGSTPGAAPAQVSRPGGPPPGVSDGREGTGDTFVDKDEVYRERVPTSGPAAGTVGRRDGDDDLFSPQNLGIAAAAGAAGGLAVAGWYALRRRRWRKAVAAARRPARPTRSINSPPPSRPA